MSEKPKIERFRFTLQVGNVQDNRFVTGASVTRDLIVNPDDGAWETLVGLIGLLAHALRHVLSVATEGGWE